MRDVDVWDYASYTVRAMAEIGYDISQCIPKQLTPEMINDADKVIVMASSITWPDFLVTSDKVMTWDVKDPGETKTYEAHVAAREQIKGLVEKLLGL